MYFSHLQNSLSTKFLKILNIIVVRTHHADKTLFSLVFERGGANMLP